MEYEIDTQHSLFDSSTNPSLEKARRKGAGNMTKAQRALFIPEEEPETQMH